MLKRISAYTLVELMIIVVILLILASFALIKYTNVVEKGRSAEAYAVLADIASAESAYNVEYGEYTTTLTNLDIYTDDPESNNFTYTVNINDEYVQAAPRAGAGSVTYRMCISGGDKGSSATSMPTCP